MEDVMPKGLVKWFSFSKGYGFIVEKDGAELFVHVSNVKDGVSLEEGMEVEYEIGQGDKGPFAKEVNPTSDRSLYY